MNDRQNKLKELAQVLCAPRDPSLCPLIANGGKCEKAGECRIAQKTDEQLQYIFSGTATNVFLSACAGSGKTEVLGIKAAYEINKWQSAYSGMAVLTFTNAATETIKTRLAGFYRGAVPERHFVGTVSSFIQGFITQKFAYMYRKGCTERDRSFTVVDADASSFKKNYLQKYAVGIGIIKAPVYAHTLYERGSTKEWICAGYNHQENVRLRKIYDNGTPPKKNGYGKKHSFEEFENEVKQSKNTFCNDGFANFEDMENMALKVLVDNGGIARLISQKFPLILIDECQDLSYTELQIFGALRDAGSRLHLIGDLRQAIYSFKDASPEHLLKFLKSGFDEYELTDNFRSTQSIVDASQKIMGDTKKIRGRAQGIAGCADVIYIPYNNSEQEAVEKFTGLIQKLGIKKENCVIAVRKNKEINDLSEKPPDLEVHAGLNAIMLWNTNNYDNIKLSLSLMGRQLQKWIGYHSRGAYRCPKGFEGGELLWRVKLMDILAALSKNPDICKLDYENYSEWYKASKATVAEVVCKNLSGLAELSYDALKRSVKAPKNTADKPIDRPRIKEKGDIDKRTIHSLKGETCDALMHILKSGKKGDYWGIRDDEERRCAYVAATRPRYLLCWAVPVPKPEEREKLKELGFSAYEDGIKK